MCPHTILLIINFVVRFSKKTNKTFFRKGLKPILKKYKIVDSYRQVNS